MEPVNAERDRRLTTLRASRAAPTVEQIVRAFIEPGFDLVSHHGARGPAVARFVGRVLFDPSPRIRQLFAEQVDPVEGRFLDALRRALPDQEPETVLFGYTSMLGLLALRQAAAFTEIRWRNTARGNVDDAVAERERLIAFVTAGFSP